VIAIKDEIYGEEVAAWIVPDREVTDPKQMVADLLEIAHGKLAHYKLPRYIYLAEQFPLTANGKVQKNKMREVTNKLL
jgi:fatty-acyl-CoA synthase